MLGRTYRLKVLTSVGAAATMMLASMAPSYAQTASVPGSWLAGPDGQGSSTIIGRVETPRIRQNVNPSASVLVSGWAVDTTAQGWSGIDGVEVWSGAKDSGGAKLATGSVGLARTDISEALGAGFNKSGFNAVIPGSAWANATAGPQTIYVYLHTPGKGTWYRTVGVTLLAPLSLPFPSDPVVYIAKPQEGMNITQKQNNSKFTFSGVALDRNPLSAVAGSLALLPAGAGQVTGPGCSGCAGSTGAIGTSYRGAGVSAITAYVDSAPKAGDNSVFGSFGSACAGCTGGNILVSNKGSLNVAGKPQASIISRSFGSQFDYSGWAISINPALLSVGPHTLVVTAISAITGKTSTATVNFNIIASPPGSRIQP